MSIQAILFDLDGTLLDTAPEFTECLNKLLQQEQQPLIQEQGLREVVSFGVKGMVEFGFQLHANDPQLASLTQRLLAIYGENLGYKTTFFPGMLSVLDQLNDQNIPWGIVTNKPQTLTLSLVKKLLPLQAARCVIAGDTLPRQKPDPLPLLHAAQLLNVSPTQCWYIGDAKTDVQASHQAGMRCAVAKFGYIPKAEDPLQWNADCYLTQALDMTALFHFSPAV